LIVNTKWICAFTVGNKTWSSVEKENYPKKDKPKQSIFCLSFCFPNKL
jgi:hypothetical protein